MHWRWPWQTREDALIRVLDEKLAAVARTRERVAEITRAARLDAERMRDDDTRR